MERTGIRQAILGLRVGEIVRKGDYYHIFSDMGTFMLCVNVDDAFDEDGAILRDDTE